MSRFRYDPTVNAGHVLTALSMVGAVAGGWFMVRADINNLDFRMSKVETAVDKLTTVIVTDARQEEKIAALERRLERVEKMTDRLPIPIMPK